MKYLIANCQLLVVNWKKYIKKIYHSSYSTIRQLTYKRLIINDGFTLIEFLIVLVIIGILSSALYANFFPTLSKGRDSKRKQDLDGIARALELYYNDHKAYPTALPAWGESFHTTINNTSVIYMQKLPADPSYPGSTYCYPTTAAGATYKLYANLENRNDPKIIPTVSCGGVNYNYGISSQNTTP